MELSKTFDAKAAEEHWFQLWIDRGYFKADPGRPVERDEQGRDKVFSIVFPPPNVTGQLHLGHALNVTLHDVIVRMRRMQGYNTLWLPGTDHAGIATQNVVERELKKEGKTRHDLGREEFVKRVWAWRENYGGKILHQLRKLGASCDWSRERFTLDDGLSRAVTKVFVMLYREGLIYRDYRLINWCPRCETALSDLEVEHKDAQGSLWHIRYPLADGSGSITVATTRPETMLGDTAVAVHPEDERYRALVGKTVRLPLTNREIPIIADTAVDKSFGSGAVKITPAHDFNDFEMGRRHGLQQIAVMDTHGHMSSEAGAYQGLSREDGRRKVVAELDALGLLEKIEPHKHAVGVCSRCDTVVEPMLSYQWFLAVNKVAADGQSLAGKAITAVEQEKTKFFPKRWENTYFSWMRNIQDWCISRQLWWGHRIPAYWCDACKDAPPIVAEERPTSCPQCGSTNLRQDDDVLDTWFSSGLWPFSTLGWPEQTADLKRYYPNSLLITGFDIIFFWVARMMMFGLKINPNGAETMADQVPFREIYITPLVRDQYGKKMTKSRGNVVDPLEIMDKYGTDAVRFTLAQLSVQGRDLILSDDRLAASRAFANKIWNAARFVLMNLEAADKPVRSFAIKNLEEPGQDILRELNNAIGQTIEAIDAYEFNSAALIVYQFIWHEFCDWYIELAKEPLKAGGERQAAAQYVLVNCFERILPVLNLFMPFITEEIWQKFRPYFSDQSLAEHLAIAEFPKKLNLDPRLMNEVETLMSECKIVTRAINSMRWTLGCQPDQRSEVLIGAATEQGRSLLSTDQYAAFKNRIERWSSYAVTHSKPESFRVLGYNENPPKRFLPRRLPWCTIYVSEPPDFDSTKWIEVNQKRRDELEMHARRFRQRLENREFREKADPEKVIMDEKKTVALEAEVLSLNMDIDYVLSIQGNGGSGTPSPA